MYRRSRSWWSIGIAAAVSVGACAGCSASTPSASPTAELSSQPDVGWGPSDPTGSDALFGPSDPTSSVHSWTDAFSAFKTSDFVFPASPVEGDPLPTDPASYGIDRAVDDLQAFLGALPGEAEQPTLSDPRIGLTMTLQVIDALWDEIPADRQVAIRELLGLDDDDTPTSTTEVPATTEGATATIRPAGWRTGTTDAGLSRVQAETQNQTQPKNETRDCSAYEARLPTIKKKLGSLGVFTLPEVVLKCWAENINPKTRLPEAPDLPVKQQTVAYALPGGALGDSSAPCYIWINPRADSSYPLSTLSHEYWHCVEGAYSFRSSVNTGFWATEGQAELIGWLFEPDDNGSWRTYLQAPDSVPLYNRSYDAVGYFMHAYRAAADAGKNLISILLENWEWAPDNAAMLEGIHRFASAEETWASSTVLGASDRYGEGWDTEPGHGVSTNVTANISLGSGDRVPILRDVASTGRAVGLVGDDVDVVVVTASAGSGRITDIPSGGTTNTSNFRTEPVVLCGPGERNQPNRCHCPNQPASQPDPVPLGPKDELWIALSGGTSAPGLTTISTPTIDQYCAARYPTGAPAFPRCRYLSDSDLAKFNVNAVLSDYGNREEESDGEVRCHILYSPLEVAPETPLRILEIHLVVATDVPPLLAARSPAIPVPELGKRATRDPAVPDGFSQVVPSAPVSAGGSKLLFPCGAKYCTLGTIIGDVPETDSIEAIQRDGLEIAKLLLTRV